jgi:hypothetical protein
VFSKTPAILLGGIVVSRNANGNAQEDGERRRAGDASFVQYDSANWLIGARRVS